MLCLTLFKVMIKSFMLAIKQKIVILNIILSLGVLKSAFSNPDSTGTSDDIGWIRRVTCLIDNGDVIGAAKMLSYVKDSGRFTNEEKELANTMFDENIRPILPDAFLAVSKQRWARGAPTPDSGSVWGSDKGSPSGDTRTKSPVSSGSSGCGSMRGPEFDDLTKDDSEDNSSRRTSIGDSLNADWNPTFRQPPKGRSHSAASRLRGPNRANWEPTFLGAAWVAEVQDDSSEWRQAIVAAQQVVRITGIPLPSIEEQPQGWEPTFVRSGSNFVAKRNG